MVQEAFGDDLYRKQNLFQLVKEGREFVEKNLVLVVYQHQQLKKISKKFEAKLGNRQLTVRELAEDVVQQGSVGANLSNAFVLI